MRFFTEVFSIAALCVSTVYADSASICPSNVKGICYAVSIPSATTNANGGDIYFQITAPSTFRWVALGTGQQMSGSTIFVIYTDGNGNVTVSPRTGTGHFEPQFNSQASVQLLAGSGVANGVMTANVRYTAATGLIKFGSSSAPWISSWQSGSALNTQSQSASLSQHDDYYQFTLDLTKAVISTNTNPFSGSSTSGTSSGGTSPTGTSAGGAVSTSSSSSGSGSSTRDQLRMFQQAHGSIMGSAIVFVLPMGAIIMRLFGGVWLHAVIQLLSLCAIIAGFGIGIRLAQMTDNLFNTTHTLFGTVIVGLFLIQPLLGLLHHRQYKHIGQRSYFGHLHIWYGRILVILGIINGGLGFQLAANTVNWEIAYGVIAGFMALLYIIVVVITGMRKRKMPKHN